MGVSYYFGDENSRQPTMSISQVRRASKLCDVCPVYAECLRHSLVYREAYGVWAGVSGRVRRRIFKMMDNGLTTVDEVVEVFCSGQGDRYRVPTPKEQAASKELARSADQGEGAGGLPALPGGQVAL